MEPRFTTRVLRTLTANRKKLDKESMRKILNEAYPKGCMSRPLQSNSADSVAKTGQSLIANSIFDSLPAAPAPAPAPASADEGMQVDSASTPAPTTEGEEKEKETPKPSPRKYTAPVDGQSEDLILEGTAYLRLLLILLNLDAGKVEEVSLTWDQSNSIADSIGCQIW